MTLGRRLVQSALEAQAIARGETGMDFGDAIRALKEGKRVARAGWNGKGMWLMLVGGSEQTNPGAHYSVLTLGVAVPLLPWIGMSVAGGGFVPWLASQTDMLAEDWSLA